VILLLVFIVLLTAHSANPVLVIDGLKLLAVQLKDVHVCATMVREHDLCALRICIIASLPVV
jgi:hypothetical protein